MQKTLLSALALVALHGTTGCIITEDEGDLSSGIELQLSWDCPADADTLELLVFPDGEEEGFANDIACDATQPGHFFYDPGSYLINLTPTGAFPFYTGVDVFEGATGDVIPVEFPFDPDLGAFYLSWTIDGEVPSTGCRTANVETVRMTDDGGGSREWPCEVGEGQTEPIEGGEYTLTIEAVDSEGTPSILEPITLRGDSELQDLQNIDLSTEPPA